METPFVELPTPEAEDLTYPATPDIISEHSPFAGLEITAEGFSSPDSPIFGLTHENNELPRSGNTFNIDIPKAVKSNKKYQQQLWGNRLKSILTYFGSLGISKDDQQFDATNYALSVAKWQSLRPENHLTIDGVLGPKSWSVLKYLLPGVPATPPVVRTPSRWLSLISDTVSCPAEPLLHGAEAYKRVVTAIRTATNSSHYIYILGWMLDAAFPMIPGDSSTTLYNLLLEASQEGVEIRIQIWDNPLYQADINKADLAINLLRTGVLVRDNYTFGSPGVKSAIAKMRSLINSTPALALLDRFNEWKEFKAALSIVQNEGSHHEKVVVVKGNEGLIGFCGGIDINPNRVLKVNPQTGRSEVLHDVHCELRGYAAWVLLHRFMWRWQVLKEAKASMPDLVNCVSEPKPGGIQTPNSANVKILQTYNHPNGKIKDRSIRETVKIAIANARQTIHIEDQYMISLEIASWLNAKLKEPGFKRVTFVTQDDSFAKPDLQFPKDMRKKFIDYLTMGLSPDQIRDKVSIQMLHPDTPPLSHHMIHSKLYVIDDELVIIGSANCSSRSMTHDSETAAVIFNDPGTPSSFVSRLQGRMNYDPLQNIIPYVPNPAIKDRDVELKEVVGKYSSVASVVGAFFSPANIVGPILTSLIPALKPTFIDIIDPDADDTTPQQEIAMLANEEPTKSYPEVWSNQESFQNLQDEDPPVQSFSTTLIMPDVSSFFSPQKNSKATEFNRKQVTKSMIPAADIMIALRAQIDVDRVRAGLVDLNSKTTGAQYSIANQGSTDIDAEFTEAVHQFQIANYIDPKDQDGILGVSTMDTLGLLNHALRQKMSGAGLHGQSLLKDNATSVARLTNNEFTSATWFQYIFRPAWLGVRITDGVHLVLFRKLQEAEQWLRSQPQYASMSSADLGRALGFDANTRYSAARLSVSNQAMHGLGLAIDINVSGNPWIGAGWVTKDPVLLKERYRMIDALRRASGDSSLPGRTIFQYLDSIAATTGNDTANAYIALKQRSDEFVAYLRTNREELNYWKGSQTFADRNPLNGFLNLHSDLVYALRQAAGLAWGAIDFGPNASGDIMHFDTRTIGVGKMLSEQMGGFIPKRGHPTISTELSNEQFESHEAIEEAYLEEVPELE